MQETTFQLKKTLISILSGSPKYGKQHCWRL